MRLGIGSHTFGWAVGVPGFPPPPNPLTPLGLLDKASAAGVSVVQIADNLPLHALADHELDTLRRQASDRDITLEIGTRGIAPEHLRRYLRIAGRLGSRLLRVVFDTVTHHPTLPEIVETLAVIAPEAGKHGITLAIENHDRFKAVALLEIFERVSQPGVGLCFDTANSLGCMEGAEQVLGTLGRHVVNVHVKDVRVSRVPHLFGFVVEGRPAGEGDLDIPKLLARVRELGRDPNVILELWPSPEATISATIEKEDRWAAQSIGYLRRFIPD
jgi:sugar phosphate isomerase/epimerase